MEKAAFENLLDGICSQLTAEAREKVFTSASEFESRVRCLMHERSQNGKLFQIDLNPHPQAFPDEVKFTSDDTWRAVGNSIQENQRI